jgi:hypothetical protein
VTWSIDQHSRPDNFEQGEYPPQVSKTYIMSDSPPKETDVEQSAQSGEEENPMDREQEGTQQGLGDFEVKEQDRWLPIANGWLCFISLPWSQYLICSSLALPTACLRV